MRNPALVLTAVLLIISFGNCLRFIAGGNFRTVEFLSVLVMGFLAGILLMQFIRMKKGKP